MAPRRRLDYADPDVRQPQPRWWEGNLIDWGFSILGAFAMLFVLAALLWWIDFVMSRLR